MRRSIVVHSPVAIRIFVEIIVGMLYNVCIEAELANGEEDGEDAQTKCDIDEVRHIWKGDRAGSTCY